MTDNVRNKNYFHVGKFWDSLNDETQEQILFDLDYDSDEKSIRKTDFEYLPSKFKRFLIKDFNNFEQTKSLTYLQIRFQHVYPKDMDLTAEWWNRMTEQEQLTICEPYDDDFQDGDGKITEYVTWEDMCDNDKWTLHENRLANMSPPIILNKTLSLKQGSACVSREKERQLKTERAKAMKKLKVICWHCGNKDQKILSEAEPFKCDKCNEDLWTGDGGFLEIKVGVWR